MQAVKPNASLETHCKPWNSTQARTRIASPEMQCNPWNSMQAFELNVYPLPCHGGEAAECRP